MNTVKQLQRAITERRRVAVRYRDQKEARIVEPHALYVDPEDKQMTVDCYQVGGYSSSGRKPPFWRPFQVNGIASVVLLNENFNVRKTEGFSDKKPRYRKGLICAVQPDTSATRGAFRYSPEALTKLGPFLPARR